MKTRILILPVSAVVILGLVIYKLYFAPQTPPANEHERTLMKPAPSFQLLDQENFLHRLDAYRGRHRILIVFFDAESGAGNNPWLLRLRSAEGILKAENIEVLAVSTALPQENRKVIKQTGPFPFPLLSDPSREVPARWGRYDSDNQRVLPAMFLINRDGRTRFNPEGTIPEPIENPDTFLDEFLSQ